MMIINNNYLGIYIHIPFCLSKCNYCDFLSFPNIEEEVIDAYIKALIGEIEFKSRESYQGKSPVIDSIFIGGGTPSMIDAKHIASILESLSKWFSIDKNAEITIESNPKTLDSKNIQIYRTIGINRLSIGVQSLDDKLLNFLGRIHSASDFIKNYHMVKDAGFDNVNIDLMFGIPTQEADVWVDTLEKIIKLSPEHISFYSLQIEEKTPFGIQYKSGHLDGLPYETDRVMYSDAIELLNTAGYIHYEISNAAKKGFSCKHNLKYWSMENYLAFGLGAHSFIDGERWSNEKDLNKYIYGTKKKSLHADGIGDDDIHDKAVWKHQNSIQDNISEYIFTGLRKIAGISTADFEKKFHMSIFTLYEKEITHLEAEGLLFIEGDYIMLSKKGIDFSNEVLSYFV